MSNDSWFTDENGVEYVRVSTQAVECHYLQFEYRGEEHVVVRYHEYASQPLLLVKVHPRSWVDEMRAAGWYVKSLGVRGFALLRTDIVGTVTQVPIFAEVPENLAWVLDVDERPR